MNRLRALVVALGATSLLVTATVALPAGAEGDDPPAWVCVAVHPIDLGACLDPPPDLYPPALPL